MADTPDRPLEDRIVDAAIKYADAITWTLVWLIALFCVLVQWFRG